jgi:hypothetical protein
MVVSVLGLAAACAGVGPNALRQSRQRYNETVKASSEEEMLLNIVRLRYADTPSSLAISSIAAQFELAGSLGASPFFVAGQDRAFTSVLPQLGVTGADRPTFSLTPLDATEYARRLFTPLSLEGAVYLARTTWPIQTVFRLYLENLNWVPNAQNGSGPTPALAPPPSDFLEGIAALQELQDRGDVVFGSEERREAVGGPLAAATVTAEAAVQAAQQGLELAPRPDGQWELQRKQRHYVMHVNPAALGLPAIRAFTRAFHLRSDARRYDLTVEGLEPFSVSTKLERLDLETRSLLQALYFVANGVEVPAAHREQGLVRVTLGPDGAPFDWALVLKGLFRVRSRPGDCARAPGRVSVAYREHCFYLEDTDHETKSTFALLMELSRLEVPSAAVREPILTLPLGK